MIVWSQAILAGFVATALMTIAMYAGKIMGLSMDMPRAIGLMFVDETHPTAVYGVGMVLHFAIGCLFGVVYALIFHLIGAGTAIGATAGAGIVIGIIHGLGLGAALGVIPAVHPRMGVGELIEPPGFFGRNYGMSMPLGIVVLHVIFGGVLGVVYGSVVV
ncbi:MAG: hypothetical protein H0U74_13050 [Bradymonadaceae bacterium]|nr:hypothetical protein [Lujinxingiaceae bacterium]